MTDEASAAEIAIGMAIVVLVLLCGAVLCVDVNACAKRECAAGKPIMVMTLGGLRYECICTGE